MRSIDLLDARSALGPLITAGFAACVAAAATETWSLRHVQADAGTDDNRGIAVLAAGLAIAAVSFARTLGLVDKRTYLAMSSALAAVALAMALWFWATPVGNLDPALGEPSRDNYTMPGMRIHGSTGLFMAIVAGAGLAGALAWQWLSLRRETFHDAPLQPLIAGAFGAFATLGAASPWVAGVRSSEIGLEYVSGQVALVACAPALIVCMLRVFGHVGHRRFVSLGAIVGVVLLAAPLWALTRTVGDADPYFEGLLISCFRYPCATIHAESGLYLSLISGIGFAVTVLFPVVEPEHLRGRESPALAERGRA